MKKSAHQPEKEQQEPFTPWHAEPWVWFIISLLVVTFCWGGVRLYTVFTHRDSVVIDDYYTRGKSINQDMTRTRAARNQNIQASIIIDELTGEVRAKVTGDTEQWPEELQLSFLSPVFADQDVVIILRRSPTIKETEKTEGYFGQLPELVSGRYYLQLETRDEAIPEEGYKTGWRLTMEAMVTTGQPILLKQS